MRYDFEWNPKKAAANLRKHNIGFERASGIFYDPNMLSIPDTEHSQDEDRWLTMGVDENGSLLVLSHTFEILIPWLAGSELFLRVKPLILKQNNMKKEYDFSKGVRGKFYAPDTEFNLPIYLEPEIAAFVDKLANEKDSDRSSIVNMLLKKDKEIIELQ